jgi:2-polyprenyl-3-methyl-5-hydroxy-6-metoxy-1,4-benzoquinol methylase
MKNNYQSCINTKYNFSSELYLAERAVPKYNKHVVNILSRKLTEKMSVMDFGAGIGVLASIVTTTKQ